MEEERIDEAASAAGENEITKDDERNMEKVLDFKKKMEEGFTSYELLKENTETEKGEKKEEEPETTDDGEEKIKIPSLPDEPVIPGLSIQISNKGKDISSLRLHESYFNKDDNRLEKLKEKYVHACYACFKLIPPGEGAWCGNCQSTVYCSRTCQKKDYTGPWGMNHKDLCPELKKKIGKQGVIGRTLLRVFIDEKIGSGLFSLIDIEKHSVILACRPARLNQREENFIREYSNRVKKQEEEFEQYEGEKKKVEEKGEVFDKPPPVKKTPDELAEGLDPSPAQKEGHGMFTEKAQILATLGTPIHRNEVTIIKPQDGVRIHRNSFYLSLDLAYFNHSCLPNCYFVYDGTNFVVYANRDIKKGDQLFFRYDDPFLTWHLDITQSSYKETLWSRYQIRCHDSCLCNDQSFWSLYDKTHKHLTKIVERMTEINREKDEKKIKRTVPYENFANETKVKLCLKRMVQDFKICVELYKQNAGKLPAVFILKLKSLHDVIFRELGKSNSEFNRLANFIKSLG